jgi:putative N6-adenine-specific DNA methylase
VAAPGLAPIVAGELRALGVEARAESGGAAFRGGAREVALANLWLRAASRVVARVAGFRARAFWELERLTRSQPWERWIAPGAGARLRVTCRRSRLYHSDAVAERVAAAIDARLGGAGEMRVAGGEEEETEPGDAPLVIVRLLDDVCTLSVDTSGALLHRRGYRQATARAPMRETLAAALLLSGGWRPDAPLADPLCGSGTIPIEGALVARRIAPGIARAFAFERWPEHDAAAWEAMRAEARERALPAAPAPILASDRDAGAIEAAAANAARAGVADDLTLRVAPLSALAPPEGPGWLVSNPPYGGRIGAEDRLRDLYAQLGNVARRACPGWEVVLVSSSDRLLGHVGLPLAPVLRTTNGGIPVRIVRGTVPARARRSEAGGR